VADSNRAQFRLYRAMGQPAQLLQQRMDNQESVAPPLPATPPAPAAATPAATPPAATQPAAAAGDDNFRASFQFRDRDPSAP